MLPLYLVDSLQGQRKVSKSEGASSNVVGITGLELAQVPRVPGTRRNSEHHL